MLLFLLRIVCGDMKGIYYISITCLLSPFSLEYILLYSVLLLYHSCSSGNKFNSIKKRFFGGNDVRVSSQINTRLTGSAGNKIIIMQCT